MNPTALIAEDEPLLAENLRQELARLWPELHIAALAPHGQAAVDLALRHRPQVCFFDIRMPGLSGLEAAAALADEWSEDHAFPLLVFITAYDQYAIEAFERQAVDYLLKPVQPERLAQTVRRLQAALAARTPAAPPPATGTAAAAPLQAAVEQLRALLGAAPASAAPAATPLRLLQVGIGNSIVMVPVDDVVYFEAADKYVRVLTAAKEHLVRISLRELLPQLDAARFWQVHRSVVVRADAIERAVRDESGKLALHLHGRPERLAVSRMHAHLFKGL